MKPLDSLTYIEFTHRVLHIPALADMGVALGGIGHVEMNPTLGLGACWIDRGDWLLTYKFYVFDDAKKHWLTLFTEDTCSVLEYRIESPISGLFVGLSDELLTEKSSLGLTYSFCKKTCLPQILIPVDEPLPDPNTFYLYDKMRHDLIHNFHQLKTRDQQCTKPERLRDIMTSNLELKEFYTGKLDVMRDYSVKAVEQSFTISELSVEDYKILDTIQKIRSSHLLMREKLAHIARQYCEMA